MPLVIEPSGSPYPCFSFAGHILDYGRYPYSTRVKWHPDWEASKAKWRVASPDAPVFSGASAFFNSHYQGVEYYENDYAGEQLPSFHRLIDRTPVPFLPSVSGTSVDFLGQSVGKTPCPAPPPETITSDARIGLRCSATKRYILSSSSKMGVKGITTKIAPITWVTEARIGVFSTSSIVPETLGRYTLGWMMLGGKCKQIGFMREWFSMPFTLGSRPPNCDYTPC